MVLIVYEKIIDNLDNLIVKYKLRFITHTHRNDYLFSYKLCIILIKAVVCIRRKLLVIQYKNNQSTQVIYLSHYN